jgi:predicted Zn-dependent protease
LRLLKLTATLALAAVCVGAVTNVTSSGARAASSPTAAQAAETFRHAAAGIQFDVPDGWKAEPEGEMITVSSPDDTFNMFFMVTEGDTLKEAADALDEELAKIVKNAKLSGEPKEDKHNGMDHFSQSGTGEVEGVKAELSVDILMAKKPVIILTFAAAGQYEKHVEAAAQLIASIKRMS